MSLSIEVGPLVRNCRFAALHLRFTGVVPWGFWGGWCGGDKLAGMELDGSPITLEELAPLGLVGYGHFTSMRVHHGAVRGLTQHMDRLVRDSRTLFDVDLDPDRVRSLIRRALPDTDDALVVRVTIYDPTLALGRPGADAKPQPLVTFREAPPAELGPVTLRSAVYKRDLPKTKHTGLFGALHQRRLAQRAGADDVVFTGPDGTISEIATSNIGVIIAGQLVWPQADVLPGITMRLLSQTLDTEIAVRPITLAELAQVDSAIATNAAVGVRAISRIDDIDLPVDEQLIAKLRAAYNAIPALRI